MKEIMKQTEKKETKKHLTDAELQQATGAGSYPSTKEQFDCQAQSDQANCEKISYCAWWKGKDSYYCRYYQN